jgi:hypothetical protein
MRNYSQFDLPSLLGGQASRGVWNSSATRNRQKRLATGAGDQVTDIEHNLANIMAGLGTNALLAKTGIQL